MSAAAGSLKVTMCLHCLNVDTCCRCWEGGAVDTTGCPNCGHVAATETARMHPEDPGEPQHGHPRIGVDAGEESILRLLANGARVLEIGTGLGYSTRAFMAGGARSVDTVDIDPWVHAEIVPELELDWVNGGGSPGDFRALRDLSEVGLNYDLVFVDGAHNYESVARDAALAVYVVREGGLVVFHDWRHCPDDVRKAVEDLAGAGSAFHLPTRYGLGLLAPTPACRSRVRYVADLVGGAD